MATLRSEGISDITSSEWNLELLTQICKLISESKAVGAERIISLIKANTHLTNRAVVARHVRLMSRIKLLAPAEEGYIITGEAKALLAFIRYKDESDHLTAYEKLFFYLRLFSSAYVQLILLLETLGKREANDDRNSLIAKYFQRIYDSSYHIWPKVTIREGLTRYKRGKGIPKGLQTKFDCMLKWLQQLDLVQTGALTTRGSNLILFLGPYEPESKSIYKASVVYINGVLDSFPSYAALSTFDKQRLYELFIEAYRLFERAELRIADVRAVWHYLWVKLLWDHHIALDESDLRALLDDLIEKNVVRSVSSGRDGKLSYVSVA